MLKNYVKVALRNLLKFKAYSSINILGLAVGLASCVLIFLYVQDELSYDRYHAKKDRIYRIVTEMGGNRDSAIGIARVGAPWGPAIKETFPEVEDFVRFRFVGTTLVRHGESRFYESGGLFADPSIFNIFSYSFVEGNPVTAVENPNSVVLTAAMAEKYFGSKSPIGQNLNFDNQLDRLVTGVIADVPENSHFNFDFLVPFSAHAAQRPDWMGHWGRLNYHLYLLLSEEADPVLFQQKLPDFLKQHLDASENLLANASLQPLTSIHLHSQLFREFEPNGNIAYVYVFSISAILILMVASINFMNLATARSVTRSKEIGMRKVSGAQRIQLIWQFMSESTLMSIIALLLALALAKLSLPMFNEVADKNVDLKLFQTPVYLGGLILFSIAVGLFAGSYPAFVFSAFRPVSILSQQGSGAATGSRFRRTLVITQFTASIALLIAILVINNQIEYITGKDLGFDKEQIVSIPIRTRLDEGRYQAIRNELESHANVSGVTAASGNFGGGDWGMGFRLESAPQSESISTRMLIVDYNYFDVMGMEIAEGRFFSEAHVTDAGQAFIFNETASELLGPKSALGQRLNIGGGWRTGPVIGVVKDFHFRSLHETIQPLIMWVDPSNFNLFYVRVQPEEIAQTIVFMETKWAEFFPDTPFAYSFLDETFDRLYRADKRFGEVVYYFTILAILVACLGLFGLASFTTRQRVREIGVRKVLGATVPNVVFLISKQFTKLVLYAFLIATPIAYFLLSQWLNGYAYKTSLSPITFLVAGGIVLGIALATVGLQAVKAALANPVESLRYE